MRRPTTPYGAGRLRLHCAADRHDAVRPSGRQVGLGGSRRRRDQARHAEPGQPHRRFYGTVGQAPPAMTRQQPDEPGPVRLRQSDRLRRDHRCGVRQRRALRADHDVDGGRRLRVLLDPQLLEHDLRRLHPLQYNNTVVEQPLVLRRRRWHRCSVAGFQVAAGDLRSELQPVADRHASRLVPAAGLRFAVDVLYTASSSDMAGQTITLARRRSPTVGARPTGVYTVKDLGISRSSSAPSAPGAPTKPQHNKRPATI